MKNVLIRPNHNMSKKKMYDQNKPEPDACQKIGTPHPVKDFQALQPSGKAWLRAEDEDVLL